MWRIARDIAHTATAPLVARLALRAAIARVAGPCRTQGVGAGLGPAVVRRARYLVRVRYDLAGRVKGDTRSKAR